MITVYIEKELITYQGRHLLKVAGRFSTGSVTKIYGPSGSGKTTLLKMIAGFIKPDGGKIIVNDISWFDKTAKVNLPPQNRRAGFVFQDYALFPNMTALEHLKYATGDNAWINRLLALGKLDTLTGHKPNHLSGGQQQRLAILRALATKPQLLLMDEPFSALDPEMKTELISDLKGLFKELGTTVFVVSHNLPELADLTGGELNIS